MTLSVELDPVVVVGEPVFSDQIRSQLFDGDRVNRDPVLCCASLWVLS